MINSQNKRNFADELADQDQPVSDERYAEYRRSLDEELTKCDRRDRRMRVAIFAMAGIVGVGVCALALILNVLPEDFPMRVYVIAVLAAIALGCAICFVLFVFLYKFLYQPRLQHAEREQILLLLSNLQRQVSELRERERNDDE